MAIAVFKIATVVLGYWTISISMIFANKFLVGDRNSEKDVFIFVAWIQCIVTVVFVICMKLFAQLLGRGHTEWSSLFNWRNMCNRQLMMLTFTYVSMLSFNNLCLKHVGVAFFQVARSMTLIFTVIFSILLLKKTVSVPIMGCCAIVAGGFVLGVDQEKVAGTLSLRGVGYGVTTSLFVSLSGIFTKKALDVVDKDSVKLTLYNNFNAAILFLPLVVGTGQLQEVIMSDKRTDPFFWGFLLASGILSFAIAWVSTLQIDLTSPVTHHISANSKAVVQTLLAVLYFNQYKTLLWWMSILMVVSGAVSYDLVRIRDEQTARATEVKDVEQGLTAPK